jgi:hypothetical protein
MMSREVDNENSADAAWQILVSAPIWALDDASSRAWVMVATDTRKTGKYIVGYPLKESIACFPKIHLCALARR